MVRTVIEVDWIQIKANDRVRGKFVVMSTFKQSSISYVDNLYELKEILRFYVNEHDSNDTLSYITKQGFKGRTGYDSIADFLNN